MRGHLRKRAPGSCTIVLDVGRTLRRDGASSDGLREGSKRDVEARLAQLVHRADRGEPVRPSDETVDEFLGRWLEDYAATNVRARTLWGYRQRARHLIKGLGPLPLRDLRPDHVQAYYAAKQADRGRQAGRTTTCFRSPFPMR